jgi:DNA-binding NarL/FixJ family response regulator
MKAITLGIADSHRLFCEVLKNFFSQQPRIHTIFDVNESNLLATLQTTHIDVLLLEVITPNMKGVETLRRIHNLYPELKVIILSMSTNLQLVDELFDIGIHAYISKADEPESLLQAIISAAEDKIFRNKILTDALYFNRNENIRRNAKNTVVELDEREKKILQMLWEEKSNQDIANEFFIGVRSIEKIRRSLKEKIGTKSAVGLIKYALNNRIIDTSSIDTIL